MDRRCHNSLFLSLQRFLFHFFGRGICSQPLIRVMTKRYSPAQNTIWKTKGRIQDTGLKSVLPLPPISCCDILYRRQSKMCYCQTTAKPAVQATPDKFQNACVCITKTAMNYADEPPVFRETAGASTACLQRMNLILRKPPSPSCYLSSCIRQKGQSHIQQPQNLNLEGSLLP